MNDSFSNWMRLVNAELQRKLGLDYRDLPDQPYRDWFDSEMTPEDVYEEIWEDIG